MSRTAPDARLAWRESLPMCEKGTQNAHRRPFATEPPRIRGASHRHDSAPRALFQYGQVRCDRARRPGPLGGAKRAVCAIWCLALGESR